MSTGEIKEWVSITHTAQGATSAKVTLQDGVLTARWAVKTYVGHMEEGIRDARAGAEKALEAMRAATS